MGQDSLALGLQASPACAPRPRICPAAPPAFKDGPRGWTVERVRLPAGAAETFNFHAPWTGKALPPKRMALIFARVPPYTPFRAHEKSSMTFLKGEPVLILEDAGGTPWVRRALSPSFDSTLTYGALKELGSMLKPPHGWKLRVARLDRDLTISALQGYNWLVQDELRNIYGACKDGACNFQP